MLIYYSDEILKRDSMNKYVFMRGYLFDNLRISIKQLCNKLLENDDVLLCLDSNCRRFKKSFEGENAFVKSFLKNIENLLNIEMNFLQKVNDSLIILFHPVTIHLENNTTLNLTIYLRVFKNDTMIVTIETNTDLDVGSIFETRIVNIETTNENYLTIFNNIPVINILNMFEFVLMLLNKYLTLSYPIMRNFFIIDKQQMSLENITKSLCQTSFDFKKYKPLEDFRHLTDYYHYSNELSSVIYGNNLLEAYYRLLMLDHFIIYLILRDFRYYNKIKKNEYSLKELYEIKEFYGFSYATLKYARFVEDNDYICYVFEIQNKYNLNNICASAIDKKIELKNARFQSILGILGILLAVPTLIEFLFEKKYLDKLVECIKRLIELVK